MPQADAALSLPRALLAICRERRTGVLEIRGPGGRLFLYFRSGRAVFAEEGSLGDTLGRMLLRQGALTEAQYAKVIDSMTSSIINNEQVRFGEAAVALGFLTPAQVHEALAVQVRRKLVSCMQWVETTQEFSEQPEALDEVAQFPCDVEPNVVEGIRRFFDPERCERVLSPHARHYLVRSWPVSETSERLELTADELRLVRCIDGRRTTDQLRETSPLDAVRSAQLLVALIVMGTVEPREAPAEPASPSARTEGRARALGEAVRGAAAVQPPGQPPEDATDQARRRAALLAARVRQHQRGDSAAEPAPAHRPPDDHRARLEAEKAFRTGRRHMAAGLWSKAVGPLRRAAQWQPEMPEYALYALWAEYCAGVPDGELRWYRNQLEQTARQALKKDIELAFAHYVRGRLALLESDEQRALRAFRNAVRLDPDDLEAQRYYRLLQRRQERGKK